jgi:hypothetical protein
MSADVAVVGLNELFQLKEVREDIIEDVDVHPDAGKVNPPNPHQIPDKNVHAKLL